MKLYKGKGKIIILIIFQIIYSLLNSGFAISIKNITDSITIGNYDVFKHNIIKTTTLVVLLIFVLLISIVLKNSISSGYMKTIRFNALKYFYNTDTIEVKEDDKSEFFSFLTNQLDILEESYIKIRLEIISDLILLVISTITIIYFNVLFLPLVLIIGLVLCIAPMILKKWINTESEYRIKNYEKYMSISKNYIDLFYLIKSFNIMDKILTNFKFVVDNSTESKKRLESKRGIANGVISFLNLIVTLIIYILGGYLVFEKTISIGMLIAVAQLMANVTFPLTNIISAINEINSSKPIIERYNALLNNGNNAKSNTKKDIFPIKLQNISFSSEDKNILDKVNLKIDRGKNYLLLGTNGSGKSTLAKIISGIIDNYEGEIISGDSYHLSEIIYISKDNQIFDDTVKNNLGLYGHFKIDESYIKLFNLKDDFLKKNANDLSDGEKQKLIYLRSLKANKQLMIYDEPDSSLDEQSRKCIINDILDNGLTNIVISHHPFRIIDKFDEIWSVENGSIRIYNSSSEYLNKQSNL